ncbi:MAG TPA: DUF3578 domain-containing protein [Conexibacter sp.]|jgi:5-methylcytosine-specific restriction protein A|nr:DUF3578 domain-containing protein [Conexibacter sp.]
MSALAPPPPTPSSHDTLQGALEETLTVVTRPRIAPAVRSADPLFELVTRTLRDAVAEIVQDQQTYKVEGSVGRGNWAETAWVSVFDLNITDSATRGVYLVYLIREDGNIAAIAYDRGAIPDDTVLAADLRRMLALYSVLADEIELLWTGKEDPLDAPDAPLASTREPPALEESRQFALHRRAEGRSRRAAELAKRFHGYRCWVCRVDYVERLGAIGRRCVDAHHVVPYAELDEQPRPIKPAEDFAIVCANCHRLLHTESPPLELDVARKLMAV